MQKKLGLLFKITDKLTQKESDLKITNFLQINIGQELHDTGFGDVFLNVTPQVEATKEKKLKSLHAKWGKYLQIVYLIRN